MTGELAEFITLVIPVVGASGGMAWAGVKLALNGTQKRIAEAREESRAGQERIEKKVDDLVNIFHDTREDLANVKGQLGLATAAARPSA